MAVLSTAARKTRITAYKSKMLQRLESKVIDTNKPEFADLKTNAGKLMSSLGGEIILERDLRQDGSLRGAYSVSPDALAAMLPDIKVDTANVSGWKRHLDRWRGEGIDVDGLFTGVADPRPDEYELTVTEDLLMLNIDAMSNFEAKNKLKELQGKATQGEGGLSPL